MRLREMLQIIEENAPKLSVRTAMEHPNTTRVTGLRECLGAIEALREVPALKDLAEGLLAQPLSLHRGETFVAPNEIVSSFNQLANQFSEVATRLRVALRSVVSRQDPLSISVLIPHPRDFDELLETVKDVKLGLDDALLIALGEKLTFLGFDVGTDWIELLAATVKGVAFIGAIFGGAAAIITARARAAVTRAEAESVVIDNDHKRVIDQFAETILNRTKDAIVKELLERHAPDKAQTPEITGKVLHALERVADLRARGMNVLPALTAPADLKAAYESAGDGQVLAGASAPALLLPKPNGAGEEPSEG